MYRATLTPVFAILLMGASATSNLDIVVTGPSSPSSCPDDDGSSGASVGPANLPTLLDGYAVTINGTGGLGCKVAGVDYVVGVTPGTVLKNPRTAGLPTGCTLTTNTLTCSRNDTTIDGYDFGNTGVSLVIADNVSGTTISNNNFFVNANDDSGSSLRVGLTFGAGVVGNALITKNHLGSRDAVLIMNTNALVTIQYNIFDGAWEDNWDILGPHDSISHFAQFVMKWNLFLGPKGGSLSSGGHPDGIQFNGGNFSNPQMIHNTYYLQSGWDQPLHVESQINPMSVINNPVTAFNTIINRVGGNYLIACKQDGMPPSFVVNNYQAYGNYFDASGISNHWAGNVYGCKGATWGSPYANRGMIAGQVCSTNPAGTDECR